jgi:hypothetical protein
MGILVNHDSITGTASQRVSDDYKQRAFAAMDTSNKLYQNFLN